MNLTDKGLFLISDEVYQDPQLKKPNYGYMHAKTHGFIYLASSGKTHSATGFFGVSFYHKAADVIVIAFRGSKHANDWVKNSTRIATGRTPLQYEEVLAFIKKIRAIHPDTPFMLTGHSAGGANAQLAGVALKLKAVSWDSPAVGVIGRALFTREAILAADIKNYAGPPNAINCGDHLVPIQRLDVEVNDILENRGIMGFGDYTEKAHTAHSILKGFNVDGSARVMPSESAKTDLKTIDDTYKYYSAKWVEVHWDRNPIIVPAHVIGGKNKKGQRLHELYATKEDCLNAFQNTGHVFFKSLDRLKSFLSASSQTPSTQENLSQGSSTLLLSSEKEG